MTRLSGMKRAEHVTRLEETAIAYKYRVIRNDCRGFKKLSYTVHLR